MRNRVVNVLTLVFMLVVFQNCGFADVKFTAGSGSGSGGKSDVLTGMNSTETEEIALSDSGATKTIYCWGSVAVPLISFNGSGFDDVEIDFRVFASPEGAHRIEGRFRYMDARNPTLGIYYHERAVSMIDAAAAKETDSAPNSQVVYTTLAGAGSSTSLRAVVPAYGQNFAAIAYFTGTPGGLLEGVGFPIRCSRGFEPRTN